MFIQKYYHLEAVVCGAGEFCCVCYPVNPIKSVRLGKMIKLKGHYVVL